jgi:hypothetical protein
MIGSIDMFASSTIMAVSSNTRITARFIVEGDAAPASLRFFTSVVRSQRRHRDDRSAHEECAADADPCRQETAHKRSHEIAGEGACRQHAERPARALARHLRPDHHDRRGRVTADQSREQPQRHEFGQVVREPDQRHHDGHADRGADQHGLASVPVGKAPPQRRGNRGAEERGTECNAGPLHDRRRRAHAQLLHVQRQERQQHAETQQRRKRADYADEKIAPPVRCIALRIAEHRSVAGRRHERTGCLLIHVNLYRSIGRWANGPEHLRRSGLPPRKAMDDLHNISI